MPTPPTFQLQDLTAAAPADYRRSRRPLSQIRAAVLHQMGVGTWTETNPMLAKVRAHFVVLQSGRVIQNHPLECRMRYGSGVANRWAITIEHAGNFPTRYRDGVPLYWAPAKFGRSVLGEPQVVAARELLAWLAVQVPGLQVGTHRQIERKKSGCCGPDLWREVGQYAVDSLGLPEMSLAGGLNIPDDWRGAPRFPSVNPTPNEEPRP